MGILLGWHAMLGMPKRDETWHRQDIADELAEYREARGFVHRWSELSDVAYTYTRARYWSGLRMIERPVGYGKYLLGLFYMFPKYSLRWMLYRTAGRRVRSEARLHEVRNPKKVEKLHHIAEKYGLDPGRFEQECKKLLRYWPLLP